MSGLRSLEFAGTERFRVQRRLGEGGMGVVYEVYDRQRAQTVALKTLLRLNAGAIYRFKREFRALADVSHPNLVTLHELVADSDTWFYTMELIDGVDFLEYVRPGSRADDDLTAPTAAELDPEQLAKVTLSMPDAAQLAELTIDDSTQAILGKAPPPLELDRLRHAMQHLAEGLVALHDAGKLHRDIKPSNVLITKDDRVVLLDFGLATDLDEDSLAKSHMGMVVGTVAYMPPEQTGGDAPSKASDWYSVGVMLFRALAGRLPFTGGIYNVIFDKQNKEAPLASEFEQELPQDLVRLAADLLRTNPKDRPLGREILKRLGGRVPHLATPVYTRTAPELGGPSLVGRKSHLDALERCFDTSVAGTPIVVHVSGAAGIGKTALTKHFVEGLGDRAHVFRGRCYEHELVPYKALDSLIDNLSRALRHRNEADVKSLLPTEIRALARVFPVLNRVDAVHRMSAQAADIPDPLELRSRAFKAFKGLVSSLRTEKPVVLLLDDLQHGDADSAAMLAHLLSPPNAPAVMVIAAYRTDDRDSNELLRALRAPVVDGAFRVEEVLVGPLTQAASYELAKEMLRARQAPPDGEEDSRAEIRTTVPAVPPPEIGERARHIATESRGNPLFIFELASHAKAVLSAPKKEPSMPPPLTLDDAVKKRVDDLPAEARRLLEILAVADRPLPRQVANRAANLDPRDYAAPALLITQHLARTRPTAEGDEIECYHDRIRLAVRERLGSDELRRRHFAIATAFGAGNEVDPERIVRHLEQSGRIDEAANAARRTANRLSDSLAFDQAVALTSKAIELSSNDKSRYELFKEHAVALEQAGRPDAAEAYLETADEAPTPAHALEMKRRAAEQFLRAGRIEPGLDTLREVLSAHGMPLPPTPERAITELRVHRSRLLMRGLDFEEKSRREMDRNLLMQADACWTAAVGLTMLEPITSAIFSTRYLYLSLNSGDPNRIARALATELAYLTGEGKPHQARMERVLANLDTLAQEIDAPYVRGFAALGASMAADHEARWRDLRDASAEAERILREQCTGVDWEVTTARAFGIWARGYLGEVDGLVEALERELGDARTRRNLYASTILRMAGNSNVVWLMADQPAIAKKQLEEARSKSVRAGFFLHHWWALASLVQIDMYTGHGKRAWRRMSKAWKPLVGSMIMRVKVIRCEALYLRARSALSAVATTPDHRPLLAAARQNADKLEEQGVPWALGAAALVRGQTRRAIGLASESAELFEEAERHFEDAGMRLHAAVAKLRRGQALGRKAGAPLVQEADKALREMGIANPPRFAALLCPG